MPDMLVRLKKGKTTFEVMVQEGKVAQYREGIVKKIADVIVTDIVWTNAHKGTRASSEQLKNAFNTDDVQAIMKQIIEHGESQQSDAERKQKLADKRQEIVSYIHKNYVDPQNNLPLPATRVENALQQLKPRIDPDVDAARQVTALVPKLVTVMAMKKGGSSIIGTITVAAKLAGATSSAVRKYATVVRETYGASYKLDVEVQSHDMLLKELARVTKGEFEFEVTNQNVGSSSGNGGEAAAGAAAGKRGKGKGKGKKKK